MNHAAKTIQLNYARKENLTGKGICIAAMDTGIGYHPDLTGKKNCLAAFYDTISHKSLPYDDNGHGTHISGILAGKGTACNGLYEGIAPDAKLIMIKVLGKNGDGNTSNVLKGVQWLLRNKTKYNIRIVNISIGSSKGKYFPENSPLVSGVNELWKAGFIVLTAAGNHGPAPYTIGAPGNSRKIITVGASDFMTSGYGKDYSGRGPTENCVKKPDIVAPGSGIVSCYPSPLVYGKNFEHFFSSSNFSNLEMINGGFYMARSGTSMATPIVSGCIALLLQKYPFLSNKEVKMLLRESAVDLGFTHDRQGWGLLRLDRLLQCADRYYMKNKQKKI